MSEQYGIRGLVSSEQNIVDCSKPDICEAVDIHSEVLRHVECCVLLERVSNRKPDTKIRIDVDLEDYYRIKDNKKEK